MIPTFLESRDPKLYEIIIENLEIIPPHHFELLFSFLDPSEKCGLFGQNLYETTEEIIVKKWNYFSDEFRFNYRNQIY